MTVELYTVQGFVEMLINKGLVPAPLADKARELARMITAADTATPEHATTTPMIEVRASQLIQHANLEFSPFEDVTGLVLLVKNTGPEAQTMVSNRFCEVVYRIYHGDTLLYDSSTQKKCASGEEVTYQLLAGQTRMFELTHAESVYQLQKGIYRFELDYPRYGKDDLVVTIE
jgi:hypothetical protein